MNWAVGGQRIGKLPSLPRSFAHSLQMLPITAITSLQQPTRFENKILLFLQLGKELSLIQLITIGYELCGSYGLSAQSSSGFLRREPRSNPQLIERYLEKCEGIHGVKAAKRASSYLVKGSASPMESLLSMLLCLPPSLGGFGLPRPELNYPIETNEGSVAMRRCDLCWPDQQFALEYDSDTFHSDESKLHLDSSRRSAPEKAGVHVVSITKTRFLTGANCLTLQQ